MGVVVGEPGQPEARDGVVGLPVGAVAGCARQFCAERDVVAKGEPWHECIALGHEGNGVGTRDRARVWCREAGHNIQQGALAAPRWAHDGRHRPGGHLEVHAAEHGQVAAECQPDPLDAYVGAVEHLHSLRWHYPDQVQRVEAVCLLSAAVRLPCMRPT